MNVSLFGFAWAQSPSRFSAPVALFSLKRWVSLLHFSWLCFGFIDSARAVIWSNRFSGWAFSYNNFLKNLTVFVEWVSGEFLNIIVHIVDKLTEYTWSHFANRWIWFYCLSDSSHGWNLLGGASYRFAWVTVVFARLTWARERLTRSCWTGSRACWLPIFWAIGLLVCQINDLCCEFGIFGGLSTCLSSTNGGKCVHAGCAVDKRDVARKSGVFCLFFKRSSCFSSESMTCVPYPARCESCSQDCSGWGGISRAHDLWIWLKNRQNEKI